MVFYVKNTTFPNLLDLIAPHTCKGCGKIGAAVCEQCKNYIIQNHQNLCPLCGKSKTSLLCEKCPQVPPMFTINTRDTLIGTLLRDLKYESNRALAPAIAEILNATFPKLTGNVVIIPLPTIARHIRERGLDHTYLIAKHFTRLRGPKYRVEQLLIRDQDTVQVGNSRTARLEQAVTAYALKPGARFSQTTTYILLDDVWTTGASLQSAYQKIFPKLKHPEKIILCALSLSSFDN